MGTLALGEALVGALGTMTICRGGYGSRQAKDQQRREIRSGAPHPTGAPVLRDSVEAGTFEHVFFAAPAKGETDRLLRAARRILDAGRQLRSEARAGVRDLTPAEYLLTTLTAASVRLFEEILTLSRLNRGRVFPSYDYLAEATGLGRATVARGLRVLERIGFLLRQRRFKRVEGDGPGPRYAQTSNVYRAILPRIVAAYLPRWMHPAPLPDDVVQHETDRVAETEAMIARVPLHDQGDAVLDRRLAQILACLSAALEAQDNGPERESQTDPEPLPDSLV